MDGCTITTQRRQNGTILKRSSWKDEEETGHVWTMKGKHNKRIQCCLLKLYNELRVPEDTKHIQKKDTLGMLEING